MRVVLLLSTLFAALFFFSPGVARAADPAEEPEPDSSETPDAPPDSVPPLPWREGPENLDLGHDVKLALPTGYQYLGQPEAGQLMEKMGNLHNQNLLGLVISTDPEADYLVSLRYDEEGFIKDDEELDAKEILEAFRSDEEEYNAERQKLGFPPLHAEGWHEEPRYDKTKHHLIWALIVSSSDGASMNLNTRVLGRKGYVSVNLVTEREELTKYRANGVEILSATTFAPGSRYEDFDASTDKVAEYGLTGLVLGGAGVGLAKAAKIGLAAKLWKGILAVLIAGKKGIVAVLAAAAALLRKVLGGKKNASSDDASTPPAAGA